MAPEIAEKAEEEALRRAEERALLKRGFTLSLPRDGVVRLSGGLSVEDAATVQAAVEALSQPAKDDDRTPPQKRADALVQVCEIALRTGELPDHGGMPPQVVVTTDYDTLTGQLGIGTLDNGQRVSATTVRRMACDAGILPVVCNGAGQVLDVGRNQRTATGSLRRAVFVRDRGCSFPMCEGRVSWCQIHHIIGWADGGGTDLPNSAALCRRHHRLMHDPGFGWQVRTGADELPEFIPPSWVDPEQRPQRNLYHRRK